MNLRQNLMDAFEGNDVEKIPVVSVTQAGIVEAMTEVGTSWPIAHTDPAEMAKAGSALHKLAGLECTRIPFCLTIEAEAMGCDTELGNNEKAPGVHNTPFESADDLDIPDDFLERGRIPTVLKSVEILKEEYPDVPVIVGIAGPFTLAGHLLGVEGLVKTLKTDFFEVEDAVDITGEIMAEYVGALNDVEPDVICVADPTSSPELLDPADFKKISQPSLQDLADEIDCKSVLHVCGNSLPVFNEMLEAGYDGISFEEKVDMAVARERADTINNGCKLVGNISTSQTLYSSSIDVVKKETTEALEKKVDILAPSCGIAPMSKLENIKAFVEARDEFYQ